MLLRMRVPTKGDIEIWPENEKKWSFERHDNVITADLQKYGLLPQTACVSPLKKVLMSTEWADPYVSAQHTPAESSLI